MRRKQGQGEMSAVIDQTARAEIRELREAVKTLFGKLDTFTTALTRELGDIRTALADMRASSGPSLRDTLSFVRDGVLLFSALAAGIIYLARGGNTEAIHAIDKRLYGVEQMMKLASPKAMSLWAPEAGK